MTINISFGGGTVSRPGSYSTVDTLNMTPMELGAFKILAFVGVPAASGATIAMNKVSYYNDPAIALKEIGNCDLLGAMQAAWGHGADLIAVSPVALTASDTDWQAAIDLLQYEFVDGIIPITVAGANQAKVDAHVTLMSNVTNRRERRAFYGHATGISAASVASTLTNELGLLATPCPFVYDATGALVVKPSYYTAAAIAGVWASQESQEPVTFKYLKFPGFEKNYLSSEITALLAAHICPVEYVRNKGYRIVQGVTLSASEDLSKVELSVSTLKADMSKALRTYFQDKYVGHAGVAGIEVTIYNDLISMLELFKTNGWINGYVDGTPRVVKTGTTFAVEYEAKPTLPINNFLITSHFTL